jgi:hypothetical protein
MIYSFSNPVVISENVDGASFNEEDPSISIIYRKR